MKRYDIEPSIKPTVPRVYAVANWGVDNDERFTLNREGIGKSRIAYSMQLQRSDYQAF